MHKPAQRSSDYVNEPMRVPRRTNKLISFPANLDDGLPELKYVSVEKNLITSLHEEDLAPLKDKPVLVDFMCKYSHC